MNGAMNENNFCDLSDFEGSITELEDVQLLLRLFGETLDDEVSGIDPQTPWKVEVFSNRFPMLRSTFNIIEIRLADIIREMQKSSDKAFKNYKKLKEANR